MNKKEVFIQKLKSLVDNPDKLEKFLIENSSLPGPRANLELLFAMAEVFKNVEVLKKWAELDSTQADVNDPRSFLPLCSAVCLGRLHTIKKTEEYVNILKEMARDDRWRMREAVAFAFQLIGENDFSELKEIFSAWIGKSGNREKRAMLVALAHPKILDKQTSVFCFEILAFVLKNRTNDEDLEILDKGLKFVVSVYTAAYPEYGFSFMEQWIGRSKPIDKIIEANLKKNRIFKKYPHETSRLLKKIKESSSRS